VKTKYLFTGHGVDGSVMAMKTFILASLLLTSLPLLAQQPSIPSGTYNYNGFSVAMKRRSEAVYVSTQDGQKRLSDLKSTGHTCAPKTSAIYLCTRFFAVVGIENEIRAIIDKNFSATNLVVAPPVSDPELINKGEILEEWRVNQKALYLGKSYDGFRFVISQGLKKIFLGDPVEQTFVLDTSNSFQHPVLFNLTETKTSWFSYLALVSYKAN
jgi:hypothetical protein